MQVRRNEGQRRGADGPPEAEGLEQQVADTSSESESCSDSESDSDSDPPPQSKRNKIDGHRETGNNKLFLFYHTFSINANC